MWQLKRLELTKLAATFSDNEVGGGGQDYLIEFKTMNSAPMYVIPVILSSNPRSTQFTLKVIDGDKLNGEVNLSAGHYDVKVYKQDSATNLNPSHVSVEGLVYIGDAFVEAATSSAPIYYSRELHTAIYYER
jgi:hypothetical protein